MVSALALFKKQRGEDEQEKPALPSWHHDAIIADIWQDVWATAIELFDDAEINRIVFYRYLTQRRVYNDDVVVV